MRKKQWGNEYRTTVICVDSFEQGTLAGRLCNPALGEGETFSGVLELLRKMEGLLDGMEFPQSFTARRSFQPPERWAAHTGGTGAVRWGKTATFAIQVMFRRNTSWQGSITWLEGDQKESFRSVLEMLLLIDGVLMMK